VLLQFLALIAFASFGARATQDVSGSVFLDSNANGRRDPGEPGIRGVAVSDQDTVVVTAGDGTFRLRATGHGLVFVSVPSGYRSVGSFWRTVDQVTRDGGAFGLAATPPAASFRFVHASDTHVSEQSAPRMRLLRAKVDSLGPAFVLITGDLVRDALRVGESEARGYYDLFARERAAFRTPVYTTPGNHEIFGIETQLSKVAPTHPLFGKAMYRSYFGPEYYSFNVGGVHFISLNTADIHQGWYHGHVDSLQLRWLERDLAAIPAGTPVVTFNHIPFYSSADQVGGYDDGPPAPTLINLGSRTVFRHVVSNADTVLATLAKRNHVLALGGHMHMRETIRYEREGQATRFENSAATVGPNPAGGRVFPSGFSVYEVTAGRVSEATFVTLP
jgi:predicted MPP superfamily phosphohydrolase